MGDEEKWGWPPTGAPIYTERDDQWRHYDNSENAVSFGFVATAILIAMFLVMALFERLSAVGRRRHGDIESQQEIRRTAREVSVLMPGELIPTFIANPAPPERTPPFPVKIIDL